MNTTDKPTTKASAQPDKVRRNDPNLNWAMYNPEKANPSTIPSEKPTAWTAKDSEREMLRLNNELIESQAQAAQLAEALRMMIERARGERMLTEQEWNETKATLAAWEAAQ